MTPKAKVAIVGASGFTGLTLLRIIGNHPQMELVALDSPSFAGKPVSHLYKQFRKKLVFTKHTPRQLARLKPDLVFTAMPNGKAMEIVPVLPETTKIVDLAADYRFSHTKTFEKVYKLRHQDKKRPAVYGLPEINREKIKEARVIGNPGCYVTASLLAALPLVRAGVVERAIFDGKSGYSGAGRLPSAANDPKNYTDNILPYKLDFHRHRPEIEQILEMPISFTPQVLPTFRGILVTAHLVLSKKINPSRATGLFKKFYKNEPFVRIMKDTVPTLHDVQGTNLCAIGGFQQDPTGRMVIVSAIDNLLKGASGQAMQNANLMLGFPETMGLEGTLTPTNKA